MSTPSAKRYCLIGAGACGLAVVKNFAERGIPFDCFEKESDVGGIWNPEAPSHVYETICLNTPSGVCPAYGFMLFVVAQYVNSTYPASTLVRIIQL